MAQIGLVSLYCKKTATLLVILLFCVAGVVRASNPTPNYALQVKPVTFLLEPQSTAVLPNTTASFFCNITAVPLISSYSEPHYPLPRVQWRFNGTTTARRNWNEFTQDGFSRLFVDSVGPEDVGYYECVALDGQNFIFFNLSFVETWDHTTVSRRAWLELVALSPVPEVEQVPVNSGAPLHLPCDTGDSLPPQGVQWSKDGSRLEGPSEDWVLLSTGSLLVFSASPSTSGSYRCMGWYGDQPLNGTSFEVSLTEDTYTGPPLPFLDPSSKLLLEGESVNLTCYITGVSSEEELTVTWQKDGVSLNDPDTVVVSGEQLLQLRAFGSDQSGVYSCEVAGERAEATVTALPFVSESHVFEDVSISHVLLSFAIPCLPSGQPIGSVTWYRNGDDIIDNYTYNATSGRLTVEIPPGDVSSVLGVYQCFVESGGGVAYSITRVFGPNFMNPPGNLTCHAQTDAATGRAEVVLNWEPPELFTGRSADRFSIGYITQNEHFDLGDFRSLLQAPVSTTITLGDDGWYQFYVFSDGARNNAPALCPVYTLDRIIEQEHPLSVSCAGTPYALWNDPSQQSRRLTTVDVLLNATCIFGNQSWQSSTTVTDVINVRFLGISEVALTVEDVPSGAVCLFGGYHQYDREQQTRAIPTDTCIVTAPVLAAAPPPTVRLGLSCEGSELQVSWYTTTSECYRVQNITVQGRCLSYTSQQEYEAFTTSSFAGVRTAGQVAGDSVCTFFGYYYDTAGQRQDIEPAQCVDGEPPDERYQLPEASNIADYPTECSTPTPTSSPTPTPTSSPTPTPTPESTLECFCNRSDGELPPPECVAQESPLVLKNCTSNSMCFKQRLYSQELRKIHTYWGCLDVLHPLQLPVPNLVEAFCGHSTDSSVVKCCNDSDACNENLQIQLPIEVNSAESDGTYNLPNLAGLVLGLVLALLLKH